MRRSYADRDGGDSYGGRGGGYGHDREGDSGRNDMDDPPHSRLFIIGGKTAGEGELRDAFSQYGTVERVDIRKDKGISYVKFSKTSEAADALEALNGKTIGCDPRPLKIVIATSRAQQNQNKGDITAFRLYLIIPKTLTESELREQFEEFGPLEYVSIVKDKTTNTSRGFGYVKYFQFSHAARAFEGCDQSYRPKFADPRPTVDDRRGPGGGGGGYGGVGGGGDKGFVANGNGYSGGRGVVANNSGPPLDFNTNVHNPTNTNRLCIMVNPILTQDKLWKLFDVVPGLQHCELHTRDATGEKIYGSVVYDTPKAAAYAMEKLHGFDYPLGSKIMIKFEDNSYGSGNYAANASMPPDIKNLVTTIQHATQMLQASGYAAPVEGLGGGMGGMGTMGMGGMGGGMSGMGGGGMASHNHSMQQQESSSVEPSMCSDWLASNLPQGPVSLAATGSPCEMRLFFVCKESRESPPPHIIKDLFSRFGNLIDAYYMKGKNFGYAKFACKESATSAMKVLNEQTIMGSFLKVVEAEENIAKRPRMD